MRLNNKVALVTGASRGIGKATAIKFAREGARLVVCDLDDSVAETVAEIRLQGGSAVGYKVDVTKAETIEAMIGGALTTYGRIDILINNAGIVADAQLRKMTDEQFERVIDVNLKGTYNCTRAVVDAMIERKSGVILNASSIVGIYGNFGQTNYAASKFGVIGMAKTWARELGKHGIRVNAVCPGFIETSILKSMPEKVIRGLVERVPLGRLGKPEEIANTFAFLASDEASYINGAVIEVCGGMTL
ncbi:3-oxoacyl-ACP reductase FabG [Noviherbaspirillum aridicola]|uniref:3-oxoacyl-[acyl-carrier-protein] reductase n=1 Tax=Noviherbaspirillum aridicola TaxID=2849687 RepID=A0ABQ4Q6D0_9BURK|nr:3-oxoacyl-ACP reductase FabG [Noviherbaspirillum aridicola]GIZ52537.1 beta-ketoacyl-ACP reductase [Noviherbaspirillum aridicola]